MLSYHLLRFVLFYRYHYSEGGHLSITSISKHADFVIIDLASLAAAFVGAYFLKFGDLSFADSPSWRGLLILMLGVDLVVTLITNPYSGIFRRRYWEDIGTESKIAITSFLTICVIFYLFKIGEDYSREMLVVTYLSYTLLALVLKYLHKRFLLSHWSRRPADSMKRIVLVTTDAAAEKAEELAYADDMKASVVVGFCLTDASRKGTFRDRPSAPPSELVELCSSTNADEVLVLVDPASIDKELYDELMDIGVTLRLGIAELAGTASETQSIGRVGVYRTLDLQRHSFGAGQLLYLPVKRVVDIALGTIGCIATLPVAAVVKLSYLAAGDTHPIFYKQTRVGLRGQHFELWKLRSMVWDADEQLQKLLENPAIREEWEHNQKLSRDPRITPVGRILRRASLDELPQFLNVLKGEMSAIGPRPLIPGELEAHGGRALYNKVKPGLTGWWGCNGRSDIEYEERLELEYYYITHCSLYLDALCVLRTAAAVFKREGAQ